MTATDTHVQTNLQINLQVNLQVNLQKQQLDVWQSGDIIQRYPVSTALNGPGQKLDTGCTPTGLHAIYRKMGADSPLYTSFVGRQAEPALYSTERADKMPDKDWILTRILWLTGCEQGLNRGGQQDTLQRYIYIHGTPDTEPMGIPRSHGCIRMRNTDIITLFEQVVEGTLVWINH